MNTDSWAAGGSTVNPTHSRPHGAQTDASGPASLPHEDIARGAYDLYTRTGHQQGRCLQNWLAAEQDLRTNQESRGSREHSGAMPALSHAAPADAAPLTDDPRLALTEQSRELRHTGRGRNPLVDPERAKGAKALNRPL